MLTIIGLGPAGLDQLSLGAYKAMKEADEIYLRTAFHPAADELDLPFQSFDELYEKAENFEELYAEIASFLREKSRDRTIVYCVPGSPYVAERAVELLMEDCPRIIPGSSFLDVVCGALGIDYSKGLLIADALGDFPLQAKSDQLFVQVYKRQIASDLKLKLMEAFEDDHPVAIVSCAGTKEEKVTRLPLYALDHEDIFDHLTSVYLPKGEGRKDFNQLYQLMKRLLSPGGCPWDRQQSHQSLKRYLLEESYEVMEAIDQEDFDMLSDELGDLLFQVVFHSALAEEEGYFSLDDVVQGSYEKIYSRHSHVFSNDRADNAEEVIDVWEKNKMKEQNLEERIRSLPKTSPLHYAQKLKKLLGRKITSSESNEELLDQLEIIIEKAVERDLGLDMALMERMNLVIQEEMTTMDSVLKDKLVKRE